MRGFVPPEFKYDRGKPRKTREEMPCHEKLEERLRKTLYYGESAKTDRPSLPLTELAVDYFRSSVPRRLGSIDKEMASSMTRNACVSPCSVMMSMIYVKRLRQNNTDYLQQVSSSDLFFISMMMASKYLYDEGVDEEVFNDEWAESANQELGDVNEMEKEFLTAMDWQLFVKEEEFMDLVAQIEERIAWTQGFDRGWFTYSDLNVLMKNPNLQQILYDIGQEWIKIATVGSTAYMAGIFTMIGATILALQVSTILTVTMTTLITLQPIPLDTVPTSPLLALPPVISEKFHQTSFENTDASANETQPVPSRPTSTETKQGSFFEHVLPQLWAVLALKDHFLQFMCAVSESYRTRVTATRCKRSSNLSHCQNNEFPSAIDKDHYKHFGNSNYQVDNRIPNPQKSGTYIRCPCCQRILMNTKPLLMFANLAFDVSRNLCPASCQETNCHRRRDPRAGPRRGYQSSYHGNRPPDSQTWDGPLVVDVMLGFSTSSALQMNIAA